MRRRGYRGLLSATHLFPEEREPIIEAGCDVTYNYYTEAGVGFARHTYETLRPLPEVAAPARRRPRRRGSSSKRPRRRRVAGIYKVSSRARPYAAQRCALMMAPSSRGVSPRDADQPSSRRGLTVAISIYDQFVPVFSQMLSALDKVLSKAEADAAARKIDLDVFVNGRLAPDMLPLVRQIQIMTDQAKGCASRLAGQESPKWADDEKTFADLHARVAKTIAHLKSSSPSSSKAPRRARSSSSSRTRRSTSRARTTC